MSSARAGRDGTDGTDGTGGPRTCMVLLAGIGDVVHGLPVAEGLRAAEPDGRITWVAQTAPSLVLLHNPSVERIVGAPRPGTRRNRCPAHR